MARPPAPRPAPRAKTEAELREEKRRRDLRNINITLYSASLLLVAAAALFIGLAIPEQARFLGVVMVAALFYGSGLVIHARSRRLRPAAVAFTGTGLALIPVVGLALYNLVLNDGPAAWLITSAAGTAAFAYAAAKIESRVVTYLALTFLLSSGLASGAALRWGIVWYFLFTVLLATLISLAAVRRPTWVNNLYLDAFVRSHRYLVPATALASVRISSELGAGQLAVLFLGFACYYAVLLWQGPARQMLANSYGLRAAGTVGVTALFYSFTDSIQATLLAFAVQIGVQTAGVLIRRPVYGAAALLQVASGASGIPMGGAGLASNGRPEGGNRQRRSSGGGAAAGTVSLTKKPARTPAQRSRTLFRVDVAALLVLQTVTGLAAGLACAYDLPGDSTAVFAGTALVVLLTFLAAAWKLGGAVEFAVAAPLVLALVPPASAREESWWPAVLVAVVLTAYLVARAVTGAGQRRIFTAAARAAGVLVVPLALLALLGGSAEAGAVPWALLGTAGALAANQAATAVHMYRGKQEFHPGAVVGIAAGGAALLVLGLRFQEAPGLTLAGLWLIVAVNVLTSLLRPRGVYLAAGPAGFSAAALIGAGVLGIRGYELLAVSALLYCIVLSRRPASGIQRAWSLAAAQAALTVLVALATADFGAGVHGVFLSIAACLGAQYAARVLVQKHLGAAGLSRTITWATLAVLAALPPLYYLLTFTAAEPGTGVALLTIGAVSAAFGQCMYAAGPAARQVFGPAAVTAPPPPEPPGTAAALAAVAAAAVVLLLSAGVRIAEGPGGPAAPAVLAGALAVNFLAALLMRRGWPALLAPAGFAAAAVLGLGVLDLRGYAVLAAAGLLYCTYLVLGRHNIRRGAYLLSAQALAVVLAGMVAADLAGDARAVCASLSVAVALLHVLRTVFARRVEPLGLAETARWGGLAAAAAVPVAYAVQSAGRPDPVTLMFLITCTVGVSLFTQLAAVVRLRRQRPLRHAAELVTAALLATVLATAASRGLDGQAGWSLALLWAALAAHVATALLLPDRFEPVAVAGFAAAAALGAGILGLHGYELLVLAGIAYSVRVVFRAGQLNRGLYVLAVQGLSVLLAVLAAADLGVGVHGLFATGAAALAVQHLVRTALHRRIDATGYSETSLWLSLALLSLVPAFYLLHSLAEARRGAIVLELLLLLAAAVPSFARRHAAAEERSAWILYPVVLALGALPIVLTGLADFAGQGVLPQPVLGTGSAGVVLLVLAVAALCGEARRSWAASTRRPLLAAAAGYTSALLLIASAAESTYLLSAGFLMAAAVFLVVSHTRMSAAGGGAWLALGVPPFVFAAAVCLVFSQTALAVDAGDGFLLAAWAAAALLQLLRALHPSARRRAAPEQVQPETDAGSSAGLRSRILGAASALGLALAAVPAMSPDSTAIAGSLTLVAALALALPELPRPWRETGAQMACLPAALAIQRIAWLILGEVDGFWSLQYWACVVAVLAGYEFLRKREARATALLAGSAVILSASGLFTVISGGGGRQMWALLAHAGLLAFGLLASRRLFTIWGALGVALAVLWYLRGYTFLLLALLGAGLIALAVWRLTRVRSDADGAESNHPQAPIPAGALAEPHGPGRPLPPVPAANHPQAPIPAGALAEPHGPSHPLPPVPADRAVPPAPPGTHAPPPPPLQQSPSSREQGGGEAPGPGEPWVRP